MLPGGATVNAVDCGGGWCRIAWRGGYGYASDNYLDFGGSSYVAAAPPPPVYYASPPVVTFGFGGPRWYGGHYRGGHRHH